MVGGRRHGCVGRRRVGIFQSNDGVPTAADRESTTHPRRMDLRVRRGVESDTTRVPDRAVDVWDAVTVRPRRLARRNRLLHRVQHDVGRTDVQVESRRRGPARTTAFLRVGYALLSIARRPVAPRFGGEGTYRLRMLRPPLIRISVVLASHSGTRMSEGPAMLAPGSHPS